MPPPSATDRLTGTQAGCLLAFLAPFALVTLVLGLVRRETLASTRALAAHERRFGMEGPDGPVLLTGYLQGKPLRQDAPDSPIAWTSALTQHTGKRTTVLCRKHHHDGLSLRLPARKDRSPPLYAEIPPIPLDDLLANAAWEGGGSADKPGPRALISAGRHQNASATDDPEKLAMGMPLPCTPLRGQSFTHELTTLHDRDPVEVLACKRGDRLVPCGDGLDGLSPRGPEARLRRMQDHRLSNGFFEIWSTVVLTMLLLVLLAMMPDTLPRRRQP